MTSYRYADPSVILLHVPGTVTSQLAAQLGTPTETRRMTGFAEDTSTPRISAVRHPISRLFGVIESFRAPQGGESRARLPDLTVDAALDIVENPRAPFDGTRSYPQAQLKAALMPQTHPVHRVFEAGHVLRSEAASDDIALTPALKGYASSVTDLPAKAPPDLSEAQADRIGRIYAEDFAKFGYDAEPTVVPSQPTAPAPAQAQIWDLWPAFFDDEDITVDNAHRALPPPDVDLDPFAMCLTNGRRGDTWAGREANLIRHFQRLQPEFADQSRLALLLAGCIVVMRRAEDCAEANTLFNRITEGYAPQLASEMKLRWLVSVCDTFADHGATQAQRAMGIAGSLLANTLKLSETERRIYDIPRPWPPQRRWANGGPLFDGMITYWVEKGEMIDQMRVRVEKVCGEDPQAGPFVREILARAERHNTVYSRLIGLAGKTVPPLLEADLRAQLSEIVKDML